MEWQRCMLCFQSPPCYARLSISSQYGAEAVLFLEIVVILHSVALETKHTDFYNEREETKGMDESTIENNGIRTEIVHFWNE